MNPITSIHESFIAFLKSKFTITSDIIPQCNFVINTDTNKLDFGDLTTNAALVLAKELKQNPTSIAQYIVEQFSHPLIKKIERAGPGFINIFLSDEAWATIGKELWQQKEGFFKPENNQVPHTYNIEFVSANPTGPLHLGHGRGAIIGDVLAKILTFLGHKVTKEFYINDAGNQITKLGMSLKIRIQQELGISTELPEDAYHGLYLIDLAQQCIKEHGTGIIEQPQPFFEQYAKDHLLQKIKQTLEYYGLTFDVWFSEKTLHKSNAIPDALTQLKSENYIYEHEQALWFASTKFGDDKDRVVRKSSGEWTYVAADIAYLLNKAQRGFDTLIMILGHDHHSYAVRLQGIRQALGLNTIGLDIILYQLVTMKASGQLVQMSKRAGTGITLHEVIDAVGPDIARFFYLQRKADAQLEFDLDLALKKTEENPVYYIQYAYVRTGSILEKATQERELQDITIDDSAHLGTNEALLLKKIISLQTILEVIQNTHQTHHLAYYTIELADLFHRYYAQNRVINLENIPQSRARLLLITILRNTFALTFDLLGISKPEKM